MLLAISLIVCTGCGSAFFTHEIDVQLEQESAGTSATNLTMSMSRDRNNERVFQLPDNNGMVHFTNNDLATTWVWESRPGYVVFDLFIPSVSTNGEFIFHFDQTSWLPWRGLKRGAIDIKPEYSEFGREHGWRNLQTIHTEVTPSALGGYHITLHLPVKALLDGTNAEFVPYNP
jgi:hypothetical protein